MQRGSGSSSNIRRPAVSTRRRRETERLDGTDPLVRALIGHVLADRHLGPHTRPDADTLRVWLREWSDLPPARAIHDLMRARLPKGREVSPPPPLSPVPRMDATVPVPEESEPADRTIVRNPGLDRDVHEAAQHSAVAVRRVLARTRGLGPTYAALLRAEAARTLFLANRDDEAYDLAGTAVRACRAAPDCAGVALAGQIGGLAAWRQGRPVVAAPLFEAAWRAGLATPSQRAAAAYWAARARLRGGNAGMFMPWLERAAAERRTFYGLIARRTLGLRTGFGLDGITETLGEADVAAIAATAPGLRAFALLQIGQADRAEAELRLLWPQAQAETGFARALMLVATEADLPDLAAPLADLLQAADGQPRDRSRFPMPRLRPAGGFRVDAPLVYGIARTESNFRADLVSSAGARGLMQIMPETARFITGAAPGGRLHEAGFNLDLGQRYLTYLAGHEVVGGDLLRLLASYNAGPGGFGRWGEDIRDQGDPLLFLEAIPLDETRAFVPRVLTYTWLYAARMGRPQLGLEDLAAGRFPQFPAGPRLDVPAPRLH